MTTIHEHEYFKMMPAREDRIRTFMQLELEACLEEVSWLIRCYNCEVLGCSQEEYPARLLPTLPPSNEDNLQSRSIRAQKGIFPASLKMMLKSEYQLPVLRPAPEISVQPDSVIGEHQAGENSTASECDPSPRRAAVVVRSEESGTPPHSRAVSTGSGPEGEIFSFEASTDGFLNSNYTRLEQEYILIQSREEYILLQVQPEVGMDDSNNANTSQAATCEKSARLLIGKQQGMKAWSTDQNRQLDRGKLL